MKRIGAALVALMLSAGFASTDSQSRHHRVPVLAELFTSEVCNSCPPADAALAKRPEPALQVEADYGGAGVNASASGPGLISDKDAELWFAPAEDHLSVDVKRGDNANKTMKHFGVVRVLQSAGGADVTSERVAFKLSNDGAARISASSRSSNQRRRGASSASEPFPSRANTEERFTPARIAGVLSARNAGNRASFAGLRRIPETHDSDFCLT